MYENFFGFKEKPFKLVPNPDYLFLSKSHEEALAHLNYALSQGDGFVEITGEVGTGKTTLCRAFLENLDDDAVAAYIFNPKLGPRQLIKTINDELGIRYNTDNTKNLIDNLNNFLILQKTRRKKVILLIDEAQNLSNNVLEQLRLLSNLETSKEKLLQIILVGQPELSDILDSHELRQLGQRITLRYHLSPLTPKECVDYIQYRIDIASQKSGLKFDRAAYRPIYKYSRGIPRVINIVCDRVLLTAFGLSKTSITGKIARDSIKELKSRGASRNFVLLDWKKITALCGAAFAILAAAIFHQPLGQGIQSWFNQMQNRQIEAKAPEEPVLKPTAASDPSGVQDDGLVASEDSHQDDADDSTLTASGEADLNPVDKSDLRAAKDTKMSIPQNYDTEFSDETILASSASQQEAEDYAQEPDRSETIKLADYLTAMDIRASRYLALQVAMDLWQTPIEVQPYLNSLDDDQAFFRLTTKPKGVFMHRIETSLEMLKRLNLPAILELFPTGGEEPGYLTLSKIEGRNFIFNSPDENKVVAADADQIYLYWSGVAYLPWKNFLSIWGIIPKRSNKDSIITLKLLLHELGFSDVEINDEYDNWTRQAIEEVQAKYGIPVDGFVGPLTKMILYQEKESFEMPRLTN
ncbi:General secretion pathway protein A [Olavius sp. associated proteobacterium Delta 1]|nr:General secretion pathway protein A [Olavius sp. associated proteobacterium Delta 1]